MLVPKHQVINMCLLLLERQTRASCLTYNISTCQREQHALLYIQATDLREPVVWVIYLAGVGSSDSLACFQSQLADVFLTHDDEISHNQDKRGGQALAGRQGGADRQQPIGRCCWIVGHFAQYRQRHAELTIPGTQRQRQ